MKTTNTTEEKPAILIADMCRHFKPRDFAINHAAGEKLSPAVAALLDPPDMGSIHFWQLRREQATAPHFHERDEYWCWAGGRTVLSIRLPDGRGEAFEIGPGWIVYCVRGVEHGHTPLEDWACFEWVGVARPGIRPGHLQRNF